MADSRAGTRNIQDEPGASCSIRKSDSAQKIKGQATQKGHLQEFPVDVTSVNVFDLATSQWLKNRTI